jgi:2',3'-cyclic-nucleotide 2'-phosphodiesterase/3'-nucleotidase
MSASVEPHDVSRFEPTLRILATSDLHTHIMPWDYMTDRPSPTRGLAAVATLIARARAQVSECLLLDNGDFLQGSALGDLVAEEGLGDGPHPMVAAMNALRYDAGTLGNHEFSHGLPFLDRVCRDMAHPLVSANIHDAPEGRTLLPPYVILNRTLQVDGAPVALRIGILGFAPPQLVKWDHQHVAGSIATEDIVDAARRTLPHLRAAGADLVIALSHSGIGSDIAHPQMENASTAIAALPGIDVVVAGHTHQPFPSACLPASAGVNPEAGTLCGKPAVMPGFFGSHLGVIDLALEQTAQGWQITRHRSALWPVSRRTADGTVEPLVTPDADIAAIAAPAHAATLAWARRRIGHNTAPLHSFFALVRDCPSVRTVARAQVEHVIRALAGTEFADLPVLSAAAPFRAGGRGGPESYSFVGAGDLTMRHVWDLYTHPNTLTAIRISGAELLAWLERSASLYRQINPGLPDQPLIDPQFPSFNFDSIDGISYCIDLSQPPRHDAVGALINPDARRIVELRFAGRPVAPDAQFVLATNSYRTGGSGDFAGARPDRVIYAAGKLSRDILMEHIRDQGGIPAPGPVNWRFMPMPGTSALFDSAPAAIDFTHELPDTAIEPLELTPAGFRRFRLHL